MIIRDELEMDFPAGFEKMKTESSQFPAGLPEVCVRDAGRHMIVSVGFKRLGAFAGFMLNAGDVVKVMETSSRRMMQSYSFESAGRCETQVGGRTGKGFRYRYTADTGVRMYGESCVVKEKRNLYYFHLYSNEAHEEENVRLWTELLSSAKWL